MKIDRGYEYIIIDNTKIYYHRHVMEKYLGRKLDKKEHVHHIDGNRANNDIKNLQLLSIDEHGALEAEKRNCVLSIEQKCVVCNKEFVVYKKRKNKTTCKNCIKESKRKFNPDFEELSENIWKLPMTKLSIVYSVSDKAIKKRCDKLGIKTPPAGYWFKNK